MKYKIQYNIPRPYYINIAQDDSKIAIRLLSSTYLKRFISNNGVIIFNDDAKEIPLEELYKTTSLLDYDYFKGYIDEVHYFDHYVNYNDQKLAVVGEYFISKDDYFIRSNLEPGFHFTLLFAPQYGFELCLLNEKTYFNKINGYNFKINSRYYHKLFDLYITNPSDDILKWNYSVDYFDKDIISNVSFDKQLSEVDISKALPLFDLDLHYQLNCKTNLVMKDQYAEFEFKIVDKDNNLINISYPDYKIEVVDGYAPHTRFDVVNGIGTFRVKALDLQTGERMRVKVYNRVFSSLADCTVIVA